MGEVWKATDETLGREVALKLLPDSLALDADRLSRFELEARVLASLNHPNIATLFSLETVDERHLLIMELVEGPDLSDRIAGGSIPVEETIAIARQIAEALEVAHEKGVVHRDLKPANIKVRDDGTVKVLDFGLAKAWKESQPGASSLSVSPTIPTPATAAGVILGTAAYMAPEQASGKRVDRRADIWSFGVVLWEMLAGSPIYKGDSVPEILASVLRDEPCFEELPKGLDRRLVSLLERCLRRDPRRRLQAIGDARVELEDLLSTPTSESAADLGASSPRRRGAFVGTAAALVFAAAILGWSLGKRGRPEAGSPSVETFEVAEAGDFGLQEITNPRVSPDGRTVAFIGEDSSRKAALYLRSLDSLELQKLEVESGYAFFSPDGEWLGYLDLLDRNLKKISIREGLASVLVDPGYIPATWEKDDFVYYTLGRDNREEDVALRGLWRFSPTTGKKEQLTTPEADDYHSGPALLPDGRSLIFSAGKGFLQAGWDLELLDLETGERKRLLEGVNQAHPAGEDHIVFWRDGRLFALPYDAQNRAPTGNPEPVLEGVLQHARAPVQVGQYHVGSSGDLVYVRATGDDVTLVSRLVLRSFDRKKEDRVLDEAPNYLHLYSVLSPDDRSLAVVERSLEGSRKIEIWLFDLETGGRRSFASEGHTNLWPVWSRDGDALFYASGGPGSDDEFDLQIYRQELNGAAQRVGDLKPGRVVPHAITPDGTLIWASLVETKTRFGRTTAEGIDQWLTPGEKGIDFGGGISISPDGHWLAYIASHESSTDLFFLDLESPDLVPTRLGIESILSPFFSADGRSLYFRLPPYPARSSLYRASISAGSVVSLGEPEPVLETPAIPGVINPFSIDSFVVMPDERSAIYTEIEARGSGGRVVMIKNWVSTLGSR